MLNDYLARFDLLRAFRDFRQFLATRRRHEIGFMFASLATCFMIGAVFVIDSNVEAPWKRPEIIYVKNWRLDRTDAEIIAQQKIDQAKKEADEAKLKKLQDAKRQEFQRMKDKYGRWL